MRAIAVWESVLLLAIGCVASATAADPAPVDVPDAALAEDCFAVMQFDVDQPDLKGLRSALEQDLPAKLDPDILFVRKYEIALAKLRACGVTSVVDALGPDREEVFLRLGKDAKLDAVKTVASECVRGLSPRHSAWGIEFAELGPWLMAKPRTQQPPAKAAGDQQKKKMLAALATLGKYPGIAFAPPPGALEMLPRDFPAGKGGLPREVLEFAAAARKIEWFALRARLDAKPVLRLTVEMSDEKSATALTDALEPMIPAAKEVLEEGDASWTKGRWWVVLNVMGKSKPTVKGKRVTIAATGKDALEVLEILFASKYHDLDRDFGKDTANGYRLREWLFDIYPFEHGKWAAKLDDLKPLLSDNPKQQQQMYRRLLSSPAGEFPRYAYTPPGQPYDRLKARHPDEEGTGPRGASVLIELEGGKPRRNGLIIYENGERGFSAEQPEGKPE